jgi:hypothetical protein
MLTGLCITLRLQLLLRFKAIHLLRVWRSRAHRHGADRSILSVATQEAGEIGDTDQRDNDNQGYDHRILFRKGGLDSGCSGTVAGTF